MSSGISEVQTWLVNWFSERSSSVVIDEKNMNESYFDLGIIDSMGLMQLIAGVEGQFGIKFNQDHFQDPRFLTINGLTEIVSELTRERSRHPS